MKRGGMEQQNGIKGEGKEKGAGIIIERPR